MRQSVEALINDVSISSPDVLNKVQSVYEDIATTNHYLLLVPGYCEDVSKMVVGYEPRLRLVKGWFQTDHDHGLPPGDLVPHVWVEDSNQIIIDLTCKQFNPLLNRPFPDELVIIPEQDIFWQEYRQRYHPGFRYQLTNAVLSLLKTGHYLFKKSALHGVSIR